MPSKWLSSAILILGFPYLLGQSPAPALSFLQIKKVTSVCGGTEVIGDNQLATNQGHGGTFLTFQIKELGYGNNPIAKLNGTTLPQTSQETIVENSIVVGFYRYFQYSGSQVSGGTFTYQNTSTNSPWNTKWDDLTLQPCAAASNAPVFSSNNATSFYSAWDTTQGAPTPISSVFTATDPANLQILYRLETSTGGPVTPKIQIGLYGGYFTWDGKDSSIFVASSECPYPRTAHLNVVATNSNGVATRWGITLQVQRLPEPNCAPPQGGGDSNP